ncbi:flagellar assembly protein FliH [Pseudomonadota bacterium]
MEKNSSKVISGKKQEEVQQWDPPSISNGNSSTKKPHGSLMTAAQIEQIQKEAHKEGFEQGKKEGFKYGHKEALEEGRQRLQENIKNLEKLFNTLETPFKQLDEQVEQELVALAIAIVKLLVRREIKTDPNQILGVVREAMAILPVSSRNVRLVLHPEDAELVREVYAATETELGWTIIEDPILARGGCRVLTDTSQVDATLESRLKSLIAPLLGGERAQEDEEA